MVSGANVGTVYLRDGQIVHADAGTECGDDALIEIVSWGEIEFAYDRAAFPGVETVSTAWNALLLDALEEGKRSAPSRPGGSKPGERFPVLAGEIPAYS